MSNTQPVVKIAADARQAGEAAGLAAAEVLRTALDTTGRARVIFASAPSQQDMITALVDQQLDWSAVHAFHMDEYIGLRPDHPQSFGQWLADRLPSSIGTFDRILPGDDPEAERRRYAAELADPVDLVCMGIGVNGHIAFNEPGAALDDTEQVRMIELDPVSRRQQVDDGCFPELAEVPTSALTVTIPPLVTANAIVCTVIGPRKADAVTAALTGPVDSSCPASALQRTAAQVFLDADAAAGLPEAEQGRS